METLIVPDQHGVDAVDFVNRKVAERGIGKVAFMGDYDDPLLLERILGLEIAKIVLIGNHDYHLVFEWDLPEYKRLYLESKVLPNWKDMRGDYHKVMQKWQENLIALDYVKKFARTESGRRRSMKVVDRLDGERMVYVHASLPLNYQKRRPSQLWERLANSYMEMLNFERMERMGYWLMIRGHDKDKRVVSLPRGSHNREDIQNHGAVDITFDRGRRYIISAGRFFDGDYGLLDNSSLSFSFGNWIHE